MPIYEYMCKNCGDKFEVRQKMSDEPLTFCSKCNTNSLQKVFSASLLINFKGAGFYANDSKAPPKKENDNKSSTSSCSSCSSQSCSSCHK